MRIQHGDKIRTKARRLPLTWHYGIWDAVKKVVIHNTSPGGVQTTTFEAFQNGVVQLRWRAPPGHGDVVVANAYALLGRDYDLVNFNCEHFVNVATVGEKKSQQVQNVLVAALVGGLAWLSSRGTYDATLDRYRDRKGRFKRG